MAKKGQKQRKYSTEFKIGVIIDMREHEMGYRETEKKYGIQHSVIRKWERIYLEEGAEGLMKNRRGRTSKVSDKPRGRKPNLDPKVEEDLIAENQRLRMEIEYLKKLSALVLAEEQKSGKKRS